MKILVFSDSHGVKSPMRETVRRETPDLLIHLGDLVSDGTALRESFPALPFLQVPGNCDAGRSGLPLQRLEELEGHRVLLSHGHLWQVKLGPGAARSEALRQGAEILLYGHTHIPLCEFDGGLWVLNPGSMLYGNYGVIMLEKDSVLCYNMRAENI